MTISRFKQELVRSAGFLGFTRRLNCLGCGCPGPVHAHHITYAEPSGMSRKVGDNWTVPLCGLCHQALHNDPLGEQLHWADLGIDPMEVALENWNAFTQLPQRG